MSKTYWFAFGNGNPATNTGLNPTFISFCKFDGTTLAPPGITLPVTGTGLYQFNYTPSFSVSGVIDGATSGLTTADRFIFVSLDPLDTGDQIGQTLTAIGTSLIAQGVTILASLGSGNSFIGVPSSTFGDAVTDPCTLFGYLKRTTEFLEGNQTFNKLTGTWDIYSRGSSVLLREKTLTNSSSGVNKV